MITWKDFDDVGYFEKDCGYAFLDPVRLVSGEYYTVGRCLLNGIAIEGGHQLSCTTAGYPLTLEPHEGEGFMLVCRNPPERVSPAEEPFVPLEPAADVQRPESDVDVFVRIARALGMDIPKEAVDHAQEVLDQEAGAPWVDGEQEEVNWPTEDEIDEWESQFESEHGVAPNDDDFEQWQREYAETAQEDPGVDSGDRDREEPPVTADEVDETDHS